MLLTILGNLRARPDRLRDVPRDDDVDGRASDGAAKRQEPSMGRASGAAVMTESPQPVRSLSGDRREFQATITPLLPRLLRVCLTLCRERSEAEDLLQESLVRAFLHASEYEGRSDLFGWLCGIIRNQFVENRRVSARRRSLLDRAADGWASMMGSIFGDRSGERSPEESAVSQDQTARLLSALRTIPEDFRMVVLLCDIEDMSYEEVASTLSIPVGTAKSRHARGRARLLEAFRAVESDAGGASTRGARR